MKNNNLKPVNQLPFAEFLIFLGIDVHLNSWKVTARLNGRELKTFSCDPCAETLLKSLMKLFPGAKFKSVYEAGFTGFSTHRSLEKAGIKNIVVNPADIPLSDKDKKAKSDTRDSRTLAKKLESDDLKAIYVPTLQQERFRTVCRLREQLKKDKRRIMAQIRSFFYTKGVKLDKYIWGKAKTAELRQKMVGKADEVVVRIQLDRIDYLNTQIAAATEEIERMTALDRRVEEKAILETAPGIGPTTSEALLSEVMSPDRFENDDHLCSYIGLIPDTRSTGGKDMPCGLTNRRNGRLRHVIIEAAWVASKKDPDLILAYDKLIKRMKASDAIIRIAKKLVRRIRRIWLNMEPYQLSVNLSN